MSACGFLLGATIILGLLALVVAGGGSVVAPDIAPPPSAATTTTTPDSPIPLRAAWAETGATGGPEDRPAGSSLHDYFLYHYGTTSADEDAQQQRPTDWRLGHGIESGDSFTYLICGSVDAVRYTWPHNCYVVRIDFLYVMPHHAYDQLIWIADVSFWRGVPAADADAADSSRATTPSDSDPAPNTSLQPWESPLYSAQTPSAPGAPTGGGLADHHRTVMFVGAYDMQVYATSAADRHLADSLTATLMNLAEYGRQKLSVGAHWADIKTHFAHVPLAVGAWDGARTATLGYDIGLAESRTLIRADLPFPTYSKWYAPNDAVPGEPRVQHEYALLQAPARLLAAAYDYNQVLPQQTAPPSTMGTARGG